MNALIHLHQIPFLKQYDRKMSEQSKKLTIGQSVIWNTWGNLLYYGTQWIITVFVTRLLGYRAAGTYSLAMSITNAFTALANYGIRNYQISDIREKYTAGNYGLSRIFTCALSLVLCSAFVIVNGYNVDVCACVIVYMVFRISEAWFDYLSAIYQREWRLDYLGKSLTIRSIVLFVVFIIVTICTHNLLIIIISMAISMNIIVLLYDNRNAFKLETVNLVLNIKGVFRLLVECIPLAIFSIFSSSIASIPRYFLDMYCGKEMLGIYASVAAPVLIIQLVAGNIFNPMLSAFTESIEKKERREFISLIKKCVWVTACITIASLIVAKVFGRLGLILLFGDSIDGYEYLLIPLILCTIATALIWFLSGLLTIVRDFKNLMVGNGIAAVICSICSVILIKQADMQGANLALLVGNVVGTLFLAIAFFKNKDVSFIWRKSNYR